MSPILKTSDVEFHFPVIGFTPNGNAWSFADLNILTSCGPGALKNDWHAGMELVDAGGRRCFVHSIRRIGLAKPLLIWLLMYAISPPKYRIELELEELPPISLDEVKDRVFAYIEAFPEYYPNDDETAETIEAVRTAESVSELHDLLCLINMTY